MTNPEQATRFGPDPAELEPGEPYVVVPASLLALPDGPLFPAEFRHAVEAWLAAKVAPLPLIRCVSCHELRDRAAATDVGKLWVCADCTPAPGAEEWDLIREHHDDLLAEMVELEAGHAEVAP